jgi:transcriptional regulator with XRE-family HTH domain
VDDVSTIIDKQTETLAACIRREREARGWSLAQFAGRSGVSKAMLSKIERGEASPTAALLGRISGAVGLTLSGLLARAESGNGGLTKRGDQPIWRDPATHYMRRQVLAAADMPLELTEVELPPGASVTFPASAYAFIRQVIWLLDGRLIFTEGGKTQALAAGDCLRLGPPGECTFKNGSRKPCRYLVVVLRQ